MNCSLALLLLADSSDSQSGLLLMCQAFRDALLHTFFVTRGGRCTKVEFQVSVLYSSIYFSGNFLLLLPGVTDTSQSQVTSKVAKPNLMLRLIA